MRWRDLRVLAPWFFYAFLFGAAIYAGGRTAAALWPPATVPVEIHHTYHVERGPVG